MGIVAFIPARAGSKRVPGKNIRDLGGHPLVAYAIQAAIDAEIFDGIYVSSDSRIINEMACSYGAVSIYRPPEFARDNSPDSEWIYHAALFVSFERFAILRPTNPFRTGETVNRAWRIWDKESHMKAVEPVRQHPDKMWRTYSDKMEPIGIEHLHLLPTQCLKKTYIQNASLEFISKGNYEDTYQPFFTEGYEGFDINYEIDFILAEELVKRGLAKLPTIRRYSI